MILHSAGFTHIGHYRTTNEDRILRKDSMGLYAVADGLGGLPGGEIASEFAINQLVKKVASSPPNTLLSLDDWKHLWHDLNTDLIAHGISQHFSMPIATTLSLVHITNQSVCWSHLGDTRIYRLRDNQLKQLTRDHSKLEEHLTQGSSAPDEFSESQYKNMLTRCLGMQEDFDPEIHCEPPQSGDRYLICSDGVWTHSTQGQLQDFLSISSDLSVCSDHLLQHTLATGGIDNLSAVFISLN